MAAGGEGMSPLTDSGEEWMEIAEEIVDMVAVFWKGLRRFEGKKSKGFAVEKGYRMLCLGLWAWSYSRWTVRHVPLSSE